MRTTNKRTNKRTKSKTNKKVDKNESLLISGLIILFASIFMLIFANSDATGVFGRWIKNSLVYLFSIGYNIFLFYLFAISLVLLIPKSRKYASKLIISLSIVFLSLLVIFDSSTVVMSSFSSHVSQATELASELNSGGLIGGVVGYLFYRLFGGVGTVIVLVIINIINIYTLTSINRADIVKTTDNTMNKLQDGVENSIEKIKVKREEKKNIKIMSSDDIFNDEDEGKAIDSVNNTSNHNNIKIEGLDDDFIDININDSSRANSTDRIDKPSEVNIENENKKPERKAKPSKKESEKTEDTGGEIEIEKRNS